MQITHPELGDITHVVEEIFREGLFQSELAAMRRQREINRIMGEGNRHALGKVAARLDPVIYRHWEKVAGEGCWADKSERESILKFAPELRAPEAKAANRVGGSEWFAKSFDKSFCRGAVLLDQPQSQAS
jgi:hypothetical protein